MLQKRCFMHMLQVLCKWQVVRKSIIYAGQNVSISINGMSFSPSVQSFFLRRFLQFASSSISEKQKHLKMQLKEEIPRATTWYVSSTATFPTATWKFETPKWNTNTPMIRENGSTSIFLHSQSWRNHQQRDWEMGLPNPPLDSLFR